MKRIFIFCLLGAALFTLACGNEESKERRLEEGSSYFRPIRSAAADPGKSQKKIKKQKQKQRRKKAKKGLKEKEKKKKKSVKQKNGKGRKAGKGKKGRGEKRKEGKGKSRKKTSKVKNQKEKRKSKKGKSNKRRKDSKKGNRNKKSNKEKKGNSKDKAERLFLNTEEETTCGSDVTSALACHDAAVDYMKLLSGKVANFVKQKKRISSSAKQAASKSSKQSIFGPLISKLREAGGGNSSNLTCNGASGPGADFLKALMAELEMCEANIEAACNTGLPSHNETLTSECEMHMETFSNLTKPAIAASGEASCQLWTAESLATAASKIKGTACDISELNTKFTAAKKNCTSAFGACRKLEDKVGTAIDACSSSNTEASLKAAIAQGVTNKALADQVVAMANSTVNSSRYGYGWGYYGRTKRSGAERTMRSNSSCGDFATGVSSAASEVSASPLLSSLAAILSAVLNTTVAACSTSESASLSSASSSMTSSAAKIVLAVQQKNSALNISTGTTVSLPASFSTDDSTNMTTTVAMTTADTTMTTPNTTMTTSNTTMTTANTTMTTANTTMTTANTTMTTSNTTMTTANTTMTTSNTTAAAAAVTTAAATTADATTAAATTAATTAAATTAAATTAAATTAAATTAAATTAAATTAAATTSKTATTTT